jgi:hypothetical protein
MWEDLRTSETRWKADRLSVTERALLYLDTGLPLEQVLDALQISRATWYRRVRELAQRNTDAQVTQTAQTRPEGRTLDRRAEQRP